MGKDIDLMQAVRDEDLSMLQKLLDRNRTQRSSKCQALFIRYLVNSGLIINVSSQSYYLCQGGSVFINICLFVCLFVSRMTQKLLSKYSQNSVERWHMGHRGNH